MAQGNETGERWKGFGEKNHLFINLSAGNKKETGTSHDYFTSSPYGELISPIPQVRMLESAPD